MKLGILGGTFDPIHLGHLLIAEEARVTLELDEVVFIAAGQPWMKEGAPISDARHRLSMVRLAVGANPFFHVSALEIDRTGPTYTVDTLEELQSQADHDRHMYLILGMDSLKGLPRWERSESLLKLCTLVAVPRPGHHKREMGFLDDIQPGASTEVVLLESPEVDISGTEIRRRVSEGLPVRYMVPEGVERYIYSHGLYISSDGTGT